MRILGTLWNGFTRLFSQIGWAQMILTRPKWLHPVAGWIYAAWFTVLSLVPVLAAPWLENQFGATASAGAQIAWAVILYFLALGMVMLSFRQNGEEEAARRGLLVGQSEFVNAIYEGDLDDPKLRLVSPYSRRLNLLTLLASGLGMALAFALLCEGLFRIGLSHWYVTEGIDPSDEDWVLYSLLNVFHAIDLFDTFPTYDLVPRLVRQSGWEAATLVFVFKGVFDLLLLGILREMLGHSFLYGKVVERTLNTKAEDREGVRRNLASTLQATGDWFAPRFAKRFGERAERNREIRHFARQILAGAGLPARRALGKMLVKNLEKESGPDERQEIMQELGALYLQSTDLKGRIKRRKGTPVLAEPNLRDAWSNELGMEFVGLPPGTFLMGGEGEPEHQVALTRGFWMGKSPVTQRQFEAVAGFNPSRFMDSGPDAPVEKVNWYEAQAFCLWLTLHEQREGRLPGSWEYRLPTEAEWEYACRAGHTGRYFSFGNQTGLLAEYAWYKDNSKDMTHAVGQKKPNDWGLFDMHGNVWEWCYDGHTGYDLSKTVDPRGPRLASQRVFRGGGWDSVSTNCGAAKRAGKEPDYRDGDLGFRVVLSSIRPAPAEG